jgi:branched-chain amino acid transport system ATP-binding protein
MNSVVLAVDELKAGYEHGAPIVRGVSFKIARGEMLAVLGPNGAGKSTLIKAVAGLVAKFGGRVKLLGKDITTSKPHELARSGLGFVPQTDNVFTRMPISDNLRLAADILPKLQRPAQIEAMYQLFPDLGQKAQLESGRLSGGQGVTIVLVEQNARAALSAADRAIILNEGRIAHEGACAELARDRSIGQLFLGLKPPGRVA